MFMGEFAVFPWNHELYLFEDKLPSPHPTQYSQEEVHSSKRLN